MPRHRSRDCSSLSALPCRSIVTFQRLGEFLFPRIQRDLLLLLLLLLLVLLVLVVPLLVRVHVHVRVHVACSHGAALRSEKRSLERTTGAELTGARRRAGRRGRIISSGVFLRRGGTADLSGRIKGFPSGSVVSVSRGSIRNRVASDRSRSKATHVRDLLFASSSMLASETAAIER